MAWTRHPDDDQLPRFEDDIWENGPERAIRQAVVQGPHRFAFGDELEQRLRVLIDTKAGISQHETPMAAAASRAGGRGTRHRIRLSLAGLAGAAVVILGVLALSERSATPTTAQQILRRADGAASVVPDGKVRHIIRQYTTSQTLPPGAIFHPAPDYTPTYTQEMWLKKGTTHTLMRNQGGPGNPMNPMAIVGENTIWRVFPGGAVHESPYDPSIEQSIMPTHLPQGKDVHILGHSVLNGRRVIEIEESGDTTAISKDLQTTVTLWIDEQTYQTLQSHTTTVQDFAGAGQATMEIAWTITTDELLDTAQVPSDLFTLTPVQSVPTPIVSR